MSLGPWMYALGFTQVFRRSIVELSRFWPDSLDHNATGEPMAHDQWYFFIASVFGSIGYYHEPLVAYVQHGSNTYGLERKHVAVSAIRFLTENRKGHIGRYAQALDPNRELRRHTAGGGRTAKLYIQLRPLGRDIPQTR